MADHRPSASPRARSRQRRRRRDRSHDCARRVRHVHHVSSVRSGSAPPSHHTGASSLPRERASAMRAARRPESSAMAQAAAADRRHRRPVPPQRRARRQARRPARNDAAPRQRRRRPPNRAGKKTGAAGARFLVMRSASPIADQGLLPSNMSMICRFSSGVTGGGVRPAAPAEPSASFALTVGLAAGLKSTLATKPAPGVRSA